MHVHLWNGLLHGSQNVSIEKPLEVSRQPTLNANLGRALFPCLARLPRDIVGRKGVRIGGAGPSPKPAEAAPDETHIREVDVPVYDVGDRLAHGFAPQRIGHRNQSIEGRALHGCELQTLLEGQFHSAAHGFQALAHTGGTSFQCGLCRICGLLLRHRQAIVSERPPLRRVDWRYPDSPADSV